MRVTSLVLLAGVVLTTLYFIFLTPKWAVDLYNKSTGFGPAETASDAVDKFIKCIKKRDFKTAAEFVTGDYAEVLKRGAMAAKEMGPVLDGISEYMKNKGLATDKCVAYLHFLDPFPTNLKIGAAPKEANNAAVAIIEWENIFPQQQVVDIAGLVRQVDHKMFKRNLMPLNLDTPNLGRVDVVKEGDAWKLKVSPRQQADIEYYLNNYKGYHTALTVFRRDVTNDRFPSKQDFERELESVLSKAKG